MELEFLELEIHQNFSMELEFYNLEFKKSGRSLIISQTMVNLYILPNNDTWSYWHKKFIIVYKPSNKIQIS